MGTTPARDALTVEVRVREVGQEVPASSGREGVFLARDDRFVRWLVLGAVWIIAGVYVGFHLGSGWVPADDGTLAQSALRVLQGQLPHRDFAEIYTGGLSMIHALAFRVLGVNLMSLRICVFLFFLAWMPAVYYIALRFTSAVGAGVVTLLAVSWSFPNYPAAMPSWYNLFFATFGAAALLRYLEVKTRRWLFVAGVCGGVSIAIKVIGAYFVAGALLFLAFLEQGENTGKGTEKNSWGYRAFSVSALSVFLGTVIYVLRTRFTLAELYHFVLPSAVVVALVLLGERKVSAATADRFRALARLVTPFGLGILSSLAIFLVPYAISEALDNFLSGMKSSIVGHVADLAVIRPAPPQYIVFVLPLVGILAAAMFWDKFQGKVVGAAVGLGAIVIAARATQSMRILSGVWFSAVMLTPVVVVLGAAAVVLAARSHGERTKVERTKLERQQVMLLTSLAATCSLVQYPFAAPIYLCYTLPLTLLALVAIVATRKTQRGTYVLASVAGLYMAFGVVTLVPMQVAELTHQVGHMDKLQLPRGGVRIENARFFEDLIHFLQQHSPNGVMYAGTDCPELYFLSGLRNVTRDDGGAKADEVLRALQSNDVKVVVINEAPFFPAGRMNTEVRAEVQRKFPSHSQAGIFQVFWRE
ncbi:MAG: hypothetical protein WA172_22100 [Terriglobales bacterium]